MEENKTAEEIYKYIDAYEPKLIFVNDEEYLKKLIDANEYLQYMPLYLLDLLVLTYNIDVNNISADFNSSELNELQIEYLKKTFLNFVDKKYKRGYTTDIIDMSFTWSNTPEGHDFWSNINDWFMSICHEKNSNDNNDVSDLENKILRKFLEKYSDIFTQKDPKYLYKNYLKDLKETLN